MNEVTEVAVGKDPFAAPGEGERTFSLLLAALDARAIETDAREDAAIEAEAISTQADEAPRAGVAKKGRERGVRE